MPVVMGVSVQGDKALARLMSRVDPKRHGVQWQRAALLRAGFLLQKVAAQKKIRRGGATKKGASRPLLGVLTSRTGTLRYSIGVDRGPLPRAVEVGSDLKYAGVHETGGTFGIRSHFVDEHTRTMAFGRRVGSFTIPRHFRMGHDARFPKRPYLVPALDEVIPDLPRIFVEEIEKVLGAGR